MPIDRFENKVFQNNLSNILYKDSHVLSGNGWAVVCVVGDRTQVGMKIEEELKITTTKDLIQMSDGLQELTDNYANFVTKMLMVFVGLLIGVFLYLNEDFFSKINKNQYDDEMANMVIRSLILLIAVIPEAVPFIQYTSIMSCHNFYKMSPEYNR